MTSGGVNLSTDNGASWKAVNSGLAHPYVNALTVAGTSLIAGTDGGGVFRSTDSGSSWLEANRGFTNTFVNVLLGCGPNLFAGTGRGFAGPSRGVFLSTNSGTDWTLASNGLANTNVYALAVLGTDLFAGTVGGAFRSSNDGTSWSAVDSLPGRYIPALAVSGTNLYAALGDGGVALSANNGVSWSAVNSGLPKDPYGNFPFVNCFAVSGTSLFAGSNVGVFRSTNNGSLWTPAGAHFANPSVAALAVLGTSLFAGTYNGVFRSTDDGANWTSINSGLPKDLYGNDPVVYCFAVSGTSLFAGTSSGIFLSTDDGTGWSQVNPGLEATGVCALAIMGTHLLAGTLGGGVWKRPLVEMTDVESEPWLPSHYSLHQNYPNPFNPSTTITYELPKSSEVRLSVYDMLGREVSVLVNERRDAGVHEVRFDASGLSSGVYFYRLRAGDFGQSKKTVLLK